MVLKLEEPALKEDNKNYSFPLLEKVEQKSISRSSNESEKNSDLPTDLEVNNALN